MRTSPVATPADIGCGSLPSKRMLTMSPVSPVLLMLFKYSSRSLVKYRSSVEARAEISVGTPLPVGGTPT